MGACNRRGEEGDCYALLKLVPAGPVGIVRDGEADSLGEALARRPHLIWRIAVAFARRGDADLLAFLVAYEGPVPTIPTGVQNDVYRMLAKPRHATKQGAPSKPSAAMRSRIMRVGLSLEDVPLSKRNEARRSAIKDLAAEADVDPKTITNELAKHFGKKSAE